MTDIPGKAVSVERVWRSADVAGESNESGQKRGLRGKLQLRLGFVRQPARHSYEEEVTNGED